MFVDETKRSGYVLAAVTVPDPARARRVVRDLVAPGSRRLHMHNERAHRRGLIVAELAALPIALTVYDAARRYRTEREARAACLRALVEDLAASGAADTRLVLERDDSLVSFDNQRLIEATRATAQRGLLRYEHLPAHAEPLLALPDVAAWCWVRSGEWRRRITPILSAVRNV